MRRLIARITGWPLVSVNYGFGRYLRFAKITEDGQFYVVIYGDIVNKGSPYKEFTPVMNCEKNGIKI